MFGGFSQVPRKLGPTGQPEAQKPLGVIQGTPAAAPKAQKPLGVVSGQGQPSGASGGDFRAPRANEPEALWNGVIHGWSGYAKANREILKRAAIYTRIRFADDAYFYPLEKDPGHLALYQFHKSIHVSEKAPRITFLPPQEEVKAGYRVIYSMMETEKIHPEMIRIMNERYEECWTPTRWNAETFIRSGLQIPAYVMPLGVDPAIYNPSVQPFIPKAVLMTGPNAGRAELPRGFLFINVFQPSFRKGHDVLIKAFEEAFANDPEAGLILGTTAYSLQDSFPWKSMKSRIWTLPGGYSEKQLASIYKACKVYVTASRGEGWNLPICEAGAVGLPIIVPRTSVHPELVPEGCGYFFDKDSDRVFPEGRNVCAWFDGIEFPDYGPKSQRQLIGLMKQAKKNHGAAAAVGKKYQAHVSTKLTWSIAAKKVADRIRAICSRPS